ncbi:unnamed protein product [Caenorhabditis brenneri]
MAYHVVYPFNFFAKLPDLARQNLTRQMKLQDLILLSSCSKRCAMAIRISRVPPAIISFILKNDTIGICIPGSSFWWKFELGEFDTENIFKIKNIPVIISQEGSLKTVLKKNLDAAFNTAIGQILYIIPSSEFQQLDLELWMNFPVDFHCQIALAGVSQVKEIHLHGRQDPNKNIKYVLENIRATKKIVDHFHHKETDMIDKKLILTTPNLFFNRAEFLKPFDNFPSTSTEKANFFVVRFDEKILINFLKWFKSVPADQIRNFKGIKWQNQNRSFKIPDLSELGATKYDLKLRAQHFPAGYNLCCAQGGPTRILTIGRLRCRTSHYIDTKDGLDILRDDGLLGTILKHYKSILFVVWHERFPKRQPE